MNLDALISQHPCLVSPADMVSLCQPLQKLGITYFGHAIIHANGMLTGICSNADYFHLYLKHKFFNLDFQTGAHLNSFDYIIWDYLPRAKLAKDYYQLDANFHLYHVFSVIKADPLLCQTHIYHFAAGHFQPEMNNFYVRHRQLLEQFILYYNEQLNKNSFLKTAHKLSIPVEKPLLERVLIDSRQSLLTEEAINDFLQAIHQYPTEDNQGFALNTQDLSSREQQCLYLLAHGHTAKTIAKSLKLSPRTIYFYIENMKKKIGHYKKNELVEYYWKYFADKV